MPMRLSEVLSFSLYFLVLRPTGGLEASFPIRLVLLTEVCDIMLLASSRIVKRQTGRPIPLCPFRIPQLD